MGFNIVAGIAGAFGGWILNNIWSQIKELQSADKEVVNRLSAVEILVAGTYVRRDELAAMNSTQNDEIRMLGSKIEHAYEKIDLKLNGMYERINAKADR